MQFNLLQAASPPPPVWSWEVAEKGANNESGDTYDRARMHKSRARYELLLLYVPWANLLYVPWANVFSGKCVGDGRDEVISPVL